MARQIEKKTELFFAQQLDKDEKEECVKSQREGALSIALRILKWTVFVVFCDDLVTTNLFMAHRAQQWLYALGSEWKSQRKRTGVKIYKTFSDVVKLHKNTA